MVGVSGEEFLKWAAQIGFGFHERSPSDRSLGFVPPRSYRRFWTLPVDPATWPHFAESILQGLDSWSWGFLWPRSGRWLAAQKSSSINEEVRAVVLRGAGIPDGWVGAIRSSGPSVHSESAAPTDSSSPIER